MTSFPKLDSQSRFDAHRMGWGMGFHPTPGDDLSTKQVPISSICKYVQHRDIPLFSLGSAGHALSKASAGISEEVLRRRTTLQSAGNTNSVSTVAVIKPPMTTVASGLCTSAPVPVPIAIGTNPSEATRAVIRTGLTRSMAPSMIALLAGSPSSKRFRIAEIRIWLALRNITADGKKPMLRWKAAMNQFAILYGERLIPAVTK